MKIEVCNHFNARPLGEIEVDDASVTILDRPPALASKRRAEAHVVEVDTPHGLLRLFPAVVNGVRKYMTNTPDVALALA